MRRLTLERFEIRWADPRGFPARPRSLAEKLTAPRILGCPPRIDGTGCRIRSEFSTMRYVPRAARGEGEQEASRIDSWRRGGCCCGHRSPTGRRRARSGSAATGIETCARTGVLLHYRPKRRPAHWKPEPDRGTLRATPAPGGRRAVHRGTIPATARPGSGARWCVRDEPVHGRPYEDPLDIEGLRVDGRDVARLQRRLARVGDRVAAPVGVAGRADDRAVEDHAQVVGPEPELDGVLLHRRVDERNGERYEASSWSRRTDSATTFVKRSAGDLLVGLYRLEEEVYARRWIVVREFSSVSWVFGSQGTRTLCRVGSPGHVVRAVQSFARALVVLAAQPPGSVVVEPRAVVLEMERQPQLEARIRNGKTDVTHFSPGSGFGKIRVIPRPFDIEQTPHLVDLTLLFGAASSGLGRRAHQGQRHGATRIQVYSDVNCGSLTDGRFLFQGLDVVGLGLRAFTEHQESPPGSAQRDPAAERWVFAPPVPCLLNHREAEKRARGLCGRRPDRLRERPRTGLAGRLSPGSGTSSRVHLRTRPDQRDA